MKIEPTTLIGWFIVAYCVERKWTVKRFSMLSNIHFRTIYGWIHGRYHPTPRNIKILAKFMTKRKPHKYHDFVKVFTAVVNDDKRIAKNNKAGA